MSFRITSHEGKTFESQVVYLSGHSYADCTFINCTFVVTTMMLQLTNCRNTNCNWRIEADIYWDREDQKEILRRIVALISDDLETMDATMMTDV